MLDARVNVQVKMVIAAIGLSLATSAQAVSPINTPTPNNDDFDLEDASATLGQNSTVVFQQIVKGIAGGTQPQSFGQLDGAAVLGHVFPTTLNSSDIGFDADQGIVALAITIHPDFDDTPLVDENDDGDFANDGAIAHSHWVVLTPDTRVDNIGLSVKELDLDDLTITKPATHPGLPLYIDSPNFFVETVDDTLSVHVPTEAMNNRTDFHFDAVTAFLEVHGDAEPLLGVYVVYDILGGDLANLSFSVVPEPGSAAMVLLGLVGLGRRWRV